MRCASGSMMKGTGSYRNLIPTEGTRLREVYDLFYSNKGLPVKYINSAGRSRDTCQLIDYYGLDIRRLRNGVWVLAGEWFGKTYVDYIAERIKDGEQ